jgi:hypothetical protein
MDPFEAQLSRILREHDVAVVDEREARRFVHPPVKPEAGWVAFPAVLAQW